MPERDIPLWYCVDMCNYPKGGRISFAQFCNEIWPNSAIRSFVSRVHALYFFKLQSLKLALQELALVQFTWPAIGWTNRDDRNHSGINA